MLYQIVSENGQKVKKSITGNGYGLPLGSIIAVFSTLVPDGFLPCNGAAFDTTTYAALYAYLGSNRLPDLRECALVGAGQSSNDYDASTNPNGIHEHDVYDVGEFKDDATKAAEVPYLDGQQNVSSSGNGVLPTSNVDNISLRTETWTAGNNCSVPMMCVLYNGKKRVLTIHNGSTTHGKQVGVNYCIKATPAYVEPDTVSDMIAVINRNNTYSTEETPTGKTWIDGKPIYRKVVPIGVTIGTSWTVTSILNPYHSSYSGDIKRIISCDNTDGAPSSIQLDFQFANQYVRVARPSGTATGTETDVQLILEYTKTTD